MRIILLTVYSALLLGGGYVAGVLFPDWSTKTGLAEYLPRKPIEETSTRPNPLSDRVSDLSLEGEMPDQSPPAAAEVQNAELNIIDPVLSQGGFVRGAYPPQRAVNVNGELVSRTLEGAFFYGIGRNDTGEIEVNIDPNEQQSFIIQPREYATGQVINTARSIGSRSIEEPISGHDELFPDEGLSTRTVDGLAEKKAQERNQKSNALNSRANLDGFLQDWISPIQTSWTQTSPWGAARIKNGVERIHGGLDMAVPTGTELVAPAKGLVTLAADDFHYEGGVVFIDHGLGVTSIYLHMSEVDVEVGDIVEQGDRLGAVGATGSATGPHLCWRLYAGGRNKPIDPMLLVKSDAG